MLFIDADTIILDVTRSIQSIASTAVRYPSKKEQPCAFIAQGGPSTVNSGMMLASVTPQSERIFQKWVELHIRGRSSRFKWQDEQGWLQAAHLFYLWESVGKEKPFSCGGNIVLPGVPRLGNSSTVAENSLRNMCYAKQLKLLGELPVTRAAGGMCVLSGLTDADRINLHDWNGRYDWYGAELVFVPELRVKSNSSSRSTRQQVTEFGEARLRGLFAYHGKNASIIHKLKSIWPSAKELALRKLGISRETMNARVKAYEGLILKSYSTNMKASQAREERAAQGLDRGGPRTAGGRGWRKEVVAPVMELSNDQYAQLMSKLFAGKGVSGRSNAVETIHLHGGSDADHRNIARCREETLKMLREDGLETDWMPHEWRDIEKAWTVPS